MRRGREILLLSALCAATQAAQPALGPCVSSARAEGGLRLVFRAPATGAPRGAQITLLLRLRSEPPGQVRVNGRQARVASQARGWAAVPLPRGVAWQRIIVEPGEPFNGCRDPASAPYLVFEPPPGGKK